LKTTWHLSTPRLLFYHLKTPHNSPRRRLTPTHPVTFRQILEFFCISPNHVGHYAANVACFWLGLLKIKSEARKFSKVPKIIQNYVPNFWTQEQKNTVKNIENFQKCRKRSKMTPNDPKTLKNMLKHVFETFGVVLNGFWTIWKFKCFWYHLVSFWSVLRTSENFRYFHCINMGPKKALNRLYLEK